MRIIHLPIEEYKTRYTADWVTQFEAEFIANKQEYWTIRGNQSVPNIESGSVLDACGTNMYKFSQLTELLNMIYTKAITENDVIFLSDLWCPGLECLFYVRNITGIDFKIAGILHAGTWDPYDFTSRTGMRNWAQHIELGWLHGVDMIFVATQWHKDLIVMNMGEFDDTKIFVTGIPFYSDTLRQQYITTEPKENIVVFPHRIDPEKQPEKFDRLAKKYPQWKFIKTIEVTNSREEYFKLLARSKVMISFAQQETFGYSTVEAMALDNYVIVPNSLSYRETVPAEMRYTKESQIATMLEEFMNEDKLPSYPELGKWSDSIYKMIKVMNVKMREAERRRKEFEEASRQEQIRVEQERRARQNRSQDPTASTTTEATPEESKTEEASKED